MINFTGVILGFIAFLIIGIFHPIVIKGEYYFGTKIWWVFLVVGLAAVAGSLFVRNVIISTTLGIFGFASLWAIHELIEQGERVKKGWFPKNPNRK
jgi:branched-subunit amino acid transport protein